MLDALRYILCNPISITEVIKKLGIKPYPVFKVGLGIEWIWALKNLFLK